MNVSDAIPYPLERLLWIPGQGPDMGIMHGLASSFPRPNVPLGEAWFMGEEHNTFDELSHQTFDEISPRYIEACFDELRSGLAFFSSVNAYAGWASWFGYLAPRIMTSKNFDPSQEAYGVATSLLMLGMGSPNERAAWSQTQFAAVLALWCMRSEYWNGGRYSPLWRNPTWKDSWGQAGLDTCFTYSIILAWRYLQPQAINEWLYSVLAIEDIAWRAHLIYWLFKMEPIFKVNTATYSVLKQCDLEDSWPDLDLYLNVMKPSLGPEVLSLIPPPNIEVLRWALRQAFKNGAFSEWVDQFSAHPDWSTQMEIAMEQFGEKFLA